MVRQWSNKGAPLEVGIEIDGQQKAHIYALQEEMNKRNSYFTFARQKGAKYGSKGILSKATGGNKHGRFRMMLPQFQNGKIHFANEIKHTPDMKEALLQLRYTSWEAFGGHDDFPDIVSQLGMMEILTPMAPAFSLDENDGRSMWDGPKRSNDSSAYDSYA